VDSDFGEPAVFSMVVSDAKDGVTRVIVQLALLCAAITGLLSRFVAVLRESDATALARLRQRLRHEYSIPTSRTADIRTSSTAEHGLGISATFPLSSCSVYLYEEKIKGALVAPKDWPNATRGGQEHWLHHSLRSHPWRTYDIDSADVVLISANFALLCSLGMRFGVRGQWSRVMRNAPALLASAINGTFPRPRVATFLESACGAPWALSKLQTHVLSVRDLAEAAGDVVAPPVLAGSQWLATASGDTGGESSSSSWRHAPLLFFAGHTPKLHINPLRYHLWRQLHVRPGVTALSSTLNCTVGSWEVCTSSVRLHDNQSFRSFCHAACEPLERRALAPKQSMGTRRTAARAVPCTPSQDWLQKACQWGGHTRLVAWEDEREAMAKATVRLSASSYGAHVRRHRFCLASPGDYSSTPKCRRPRAPHSPSPTSLETPQGSAQLLHSRLGPSVPRSLGRCARLRSIATQVR